MNGTITFTQLLKELKSGKGLPYSVSLNDTDSTKYAGFIEDALCEALAIFWPTLTPSEERTPESGLIAWQQDGKTKLGNVEGVYRSDPALGRAVRIAHRIVPAGIQVARQYGMVWVRFMEPAAQLSSEEWALDSNYLIDDVVLDPNDGHCYLALTANIGKTPSTNPDDWKLQPIPLFLKKYLRLKFLHRTLSEDDGKWTALRDADAELDRLCMTEFENQGQRSVASVRCG